MSEENNMDSGPVLEHLSILTQVEIMMIARAYMYI